MAKNKYIFKNLVFEGGGVKGTAYGGAIYILENKNIIKNIKRVAGTSAGAITATLIALNFNSKEIEKILKVDFKKFKDDSFFKTRNIIRLVKEYGWFKGDEFERWFSLIIKEKFGKDLTFKDLYEMSKTQNTKELYIIGTNVNIGKEIIFSNETTPDMPIIKAVRISMSVPLFFKAVNYSGDLYVDGGIYYNYPVNIFDKKEYVEFPNSILKIQGNKFYNKETLGFRVDTPEEILEQKFKRLSTKKKISSFKEYLIALMGGFLDLANKRHLSEFDWHRTVYINALGVSTTEFDISESLKNNLIEQGKKDTEDYFKWFDKTTGKTKPLNK